MFSIKINTALVFLCISSTLLLNVSAKSKKEIRKRKLMPYFNYGCNDTIFPQCGKPVNHTESLDDYVNLIYTKATDERDSGDELHYVWSTVGGPALLVARAPTPGADLQVDWERFLSTNVSEHWGSVAFSNLTDPFIYGVFFTRLIEYNDLHDSSDITSLNQSDHKLFHEYRLDTWHWHSVYSTGGLRGGSKVVFSVNEPSLVQNNGTVEFTVGINDKDGNKGFELPFLDLTENTTHLDLEINNFKPHFAKSRFALEFVMVTKGDTAKEMKIDTVKSIDDEYSPGVFTVKTVETNSGDKLKNAYVQWKPVSYYDPKRALEVSTKTKEYGLQDFVPYIGNHSNLVYAYFGESLINATLHGLGAHSMNVSFGLTKDKFYNRENFTAWSMAVGYGTPPVDHISAVILVLVSAGLGLPVILILFGSVGVCVKRYRKKQQGASAYTGIN